MRRGHAPAGASIYERIRNNKPFLTRTAGLDFRDYADRSAGRHNQIRERRAMLLRGIVHGTADPAVDPLLDDIVTELFGNSVQENPNEGGDANEAAARRRIRTPEAFDRYFGLEGIPAAVTRQEMERVVASLAAAAESGDANGAAGILSGFFAGRGKEAAAEMVRDLRVHLSGMKSEATRIMGNGVLLLSGTLSSSVLRELLLLSLRGVARLHDSPKGDIGERLRSVKELLERAVADLPSSQDALLMLEEAAREGWVHDSAVWPLQRRWLARMCTDVGAGKDPFPEDPSLVGNRAIHPAVRLCILAVLRGEAEPVCGPAECFARYLSEHPDDLFAFLVAAEEAMKQRGFEQGEPVALVSSGSESQSAVEGLRELLPNFGPVWHAVEARLAAGDLGPSDAAYLEAIKDLLDGRSDSSADHRDHSGQEDENDP